MESVGIFFEDQVLEYFKIFYTMVERETSEKMKCLQTNNGGEHTYKEFEAYYAECGIQHEKMVPRAP